MRGKFYFRLMQKENQDKRNIEQQRVKENIVQRVEKLGFVVTHTPQLAHFEGDFYLLNNEILIALDYAHLSYRRDFTFTFDKNRFEYCFEHHRHFFQLLICESLERVFIVPLSLVMEIFSDIISAGNNFKNVQTNAQIAQRRVVLSLFWAI
ncbi:MAG: hypothetical protein HC817_14190 [Saprospiraceae bacterium]|nr:hypothetical protein [Saprospiraceae bacterium]